MEIKPPNTPVRTLRRQGVKPPITSFVPSRPISDRFPLARKSIQTYLVSRDDTDPMFSESHSCMRSWLSEAPPLLLRSRGFLEREHQPRDHYWKMPKTWIRPDGLESKEVVGRTQCFRYCTERNQVNKRTEHVLM